MVLIYIKKIYDYIIYFQNIENSNRQYFNDSLDHQYELIACIF